MSMVLLWSCFTYEQLTAPSDLLCHGTCQMGGIVCVIYMDPGIFLRKLKSIDLINDSVTRPY
jgi:hypothetical protein